MNRVIVLLACGHWRVATVVNIDQRDAEIRCPEHGALSRVLGTASPHGLYASNSEGKASS